MERAGMRQIDECMEPNLSNDAGGNLNPGAGAGGNPSYHLQGFGFRV